MRILYLGLGDLNKTKRQITAGVIPSDSLYGYELEQIGYEIDYDCIRPSGVLRGILGLVNKKYGFNLPDLKILFRLKNYDVIVVNGPFSTLTTLICRMINRKLVYLDTILRSPKNSLRKLIFKLNISLSSGTIMYSKHQLDQCTEYFSVKQDRFKLIPFAIDVSFSKNYTNVKKTECKPFILSVGRDLARDYKTLVDAMDGLGIQLKLVTLNYLLEGVNINQPWIEVIEGASYEELYQLYTDALFVVIPLKKWGTDYSSGTRSLLEAKAMGKGIIATHSLPLMEYLSEDDGVIYVEAANVVDLRRNLIKLLTNENELNKIEKKGCEFVHKNYNMHVFARSFGNYLTHVIDEPVNKNI